MSSVVGGPAAFEAILVDDSPSASERSDVVSGHLFIEPHCQLPVSLRSYERSDVD